jgi:uncharacterized LabA/DUF88 family protein
MGQDSQVAVFIDYDNIEMSVEDVLGKNAEVDWNRVLQSAREMGRVVLRRAYADWAEAANKQRQLLSLGVELVHVNSKRGMKNAADIRIVIDALEFLYNEQHTFTHVLLVSGDGDFTELVHRLRTRGKIVYGMGVSGTSSEVLTNTCDKFIYYDKLPGVKPQPQKKSSQPNQPASQNQPAQKQQPQNPPAAPKQQNNNQPARPSLPTPTTPEGKLEQYTNILGGQKIRITPSTHRPLVIYKIFDIVKANPTFTFNKLKEYAESFFQNATPKIENQLVLDVAHQLFHTFCFEFDPDSHERILDRQLFFQPDVQKPADLLDKCDKKILQLLINAIGSPEKVDKEVAAKLLYGGVRNPKILDHIAELMVAE